MSGDAPVWRGFTQAELDKQYNNRANVRGFQKHLDRWAAGGKRARRMRGAKLDVVYGKSKAERLDIFRPPGRGKYPVLIYFHGGYWRALDKIVAGDWLAPHLVPAGMVLVSVDYSLLPGVAMDELIRQCRAATAWVARNIGRHGGDSQRLHLCGQSAGGHIVAMVASTDWRAAGSDPVPSIRGALAVSGLYDLEPFPHTYLQPDLRLTPEQVARFSPTRIARRLDFPLSLAIGTEETPEYQRQMEEYAAALLKAGNRAEMVHCGGRNHFSVFDCLVEEGDILRQTLLRMMGL